MSRRTACQNLNKNIDGRDEMYLLPIASFVEGDCFNGIVFLKLKEANRIISSNSASDAVYAFRHNSVCNGSFTNPRGIGLWILEV